MAALREEMFWFSLLKISAADFIAWNLRRNGQDGNTTAVTVVEPVDQMQVPGTAAPRADRQPPCEMRLRSSSKRCRLFMSHMNPLNLFPRANRVRNAVERVAGNTVNSLNSYFHQHIHQQLRYFLLGHLQCSFLVSLPGDCCFGWIVRTKEFHFFPRTCLRFLPRSTPPPFR